MRKAAIYRNEIFAGILTEENRKSFVFRYDDAYFNDTKKDAISITLPKTQQEYHCEFLFPFFSNMIAEGENKKVQSRMLKIDERDQFGLLLSTAGTDTIGNITVKIIEGT
ncbi:MAG TPA: HipA N-terminal domain-containing protein [Chitinophagales bacterium]|nr:HipA N-terminal domain-containing protein [Chitinophagales bacterium]